MNQFLPLKCFKKVVQNAPLFAVDLVVLNPLNEILVGERLNAPAQGFWFVPGGRVYKNESLEAAFKRISKAELGIPLEKNQAKLLGLYDHFYSDSFFSEQVSTHYINAAHAVRLDKEHLVLPVEQHVNYRWVHVDDLEQDDSVHQYSKVFLPVLTDWIKQETDYD